MKILAAIDNSPAVRPVLETALTLARMLGAEVQAIHVRENGVNTAEQTARVMGVPLRIVEAKPLAELIAEMDEPDVALAVVGSRRSAGDPRPTGRVATTIAEQASKPVVLVPPDAAPRASGASKRLLVPLDATEETALAAQRALELFAGSSAIEILVLHVFDSKNMPIFLDRPEHDLDAWTREFLARYCATPGSHIELRSGRVGDEVIAAAKEGEIDLIALGWSQDMSPGHAAVVREVLADSRVPVLLLPIARVPAGAVRREH